MMVRANACWIQSFFPMFSVPVVVLPTAISVIVAIIASAAFTGRVDATERIILALTRFPALTQVVEVFRRAFSPKLKRAHGIMSSATDDEACTEKCDWTGESYSRRKEMIASYSTYRTNLSHVEPGKGLAVQSVTAAGMEMLWDLSTCALFRMKSRGNSLEQSNCSAEDVDRHSCALK